MKITETTLTDWAEKHGIENKMKELPNDKKYQIEPYFDRGMLVLMVKFYIERFYGLKRFELRNAPFESFRMRIVLCNGWEIERLIHTSDMGEHNRIDINSYLQLQLKICLGEFIEANHIEAERYIDRLKNNL